MMNAPVRGWVMAIVCVLGGCASLARADEVNKPEVPVERGETYTQVTASARYVRMDGISPRTKAEAGLMMDEAKLRAGTVALTRDKADHLLAELARVTKQDVRSTVTGSLAVGRPGRFGIGNTDDVNGRTEVPLMISGQVFTPKPEVMVELEVFPMEAKDWTIHMNVAIDVTTLERFVAYPSEAAAGEEAARGSKGVKLPSGFYKPVFAVESTKAEVRIVAGEVILLLSSGGDRLFFLTATAKQVKR